MTRLASVGDFATHDDSEYPFLWDRCVSAYCPSVRVTGTRLYDFSSFRHVATTSSLDLWTVQDGKWAITLDGNTERYTADNQPNTTTGTENFTISAWAKPTTLSSTALNCVASKSAGTGTPATYYGWFLGFSSQYPYGYFGTSSNNYPITSATIASTNQWYHLALVRSATKAELFVDGESVGTVSIPAGTNLTSSTISVAIGRRGSAVDISSFAGSIDDVRIYRRALSNPEIDLLSTRRGIAYEPRKKTFALDLGTSGKKFHARKTFSRLVH